MTLLIHPGFHKTGTTWLQEELFTDQRLFRSLLSAQQIDDLIVRPHDFRFDAAAVETEIGNLVRATPDDIVSVISSEILVGNPIFGARDGMQLANRLAKVARNAKILLTIRNQRSVLRAIYQQYVKRGGTLTPDDFFGPAPEPGYFGFSTDGIAFDRYAVHYAELFGADNVMILPQELLAQDPDQFFLHIVQFATGSPPPPDVKVSNKRGAGVSPPMGGTPLFRLANHIRRTPIHPGGPRWLSPIGNLVFRAGYRQRLFSQRYLREVEAAIARHFAVDFAPANRILQRYCPVELAKLGYPV